MSLRSYFNPTPSKVKLNRLAPAVSDARTWLSNLLNQSPPAMPTETVADMSPAENLAQQRLMGYLAKTPEGYTEGMNALKKIVGGGYLQNMTNLYDNVGGYGSGLDLAESNMVSSLRRGSNAGGMFYGGPSQQSEATLRAQFGSEKAKLIADLLNSERNRMGTSVDHIMQYGQIPATQVQQGMELGALPREIEQAKKNAAYQAAYAKAMFPYQVQAPIAQNIWNMNEGTYWSLPKESQFAQDSNAAKGIMSIIGTIVSMFAGGGAVGAGGAMAGAGAGGAAGGAGGMMGGLFGGLFGG